MRSRSRLVLLASANRRGEPSAVNGDGLRPLAPISQEPWLAASVDNHTAVETTMPNQNDPPRPGDIKRTPVRASRPSARSAASPFVGMVAAMTVIALLIFGTFAMTDRSLNQSGSPPERTIPDPAR